VEGVWDLVHCLTNFVGLRYFHQSYSSRDGIFANSPWVAENFNTVQLWSKIPVTEKIQLAVLIPIIFTIEH
jgi:hypothetical protein